MKQHKIQGKGSKWLKVAQNNCPGGQGQGQKEKGLSALILEGHRLAVGVGAERRIVGHIHVCGGERPDRLQDFPEVRRNNGALNAAARSGPGVNVVHPGIVPAGERQGTGLRGGDVHVDVLHFLFSPSYFLFRVGFLIPPDS